MCGIFAYVCQCGGVKDDRKAIEKAAAFVNHRGPDNSKYVWITEHVFFGFHRLSLVGAAGATETNAAKK